MWYLCQTFPAPAVNIKLPTLLNVSNSWLSAFCFMQKLFKCLIFINPLGCSQSNKPYMYNPRHIHIFSCWFCFFNTSRLVSSPTPGAAAAVRRAVPGGADGGRGSVRRSRPCRAHARDHHGRLGRVAVRRETRL